MYLLHTILLSLTITVGLVNSELWFACPDESWSLEENQCIKLFENDDKRSWEDARSFCKSQGGTLAEIFNEQDNNAIKRIIAKADQPGSYFWIGLRKYKNKGSWKYLDGNQISIFSFWKKETTDEGNVDACMSIAANGKWDALGCNLKNAFACQINAMAVVLQCPSVTWSVVDANTCVKVHGAAFTFDQARSTCRETNGGELVQIRNDEVTKKIQTLIKMERNSNPSYYWIGVQKVNGEFRYVNGSKLDGYTPWRVGEPNNAKGDEACVEMHSGGGWNDHYCSAKYPYVCEAETVKTAEFGCPDNSWSIVHRTCVKAFRGTFMNWYNARKMCQSFDGDLVKVSNADTNKMIEKLIPPNDLTYWIGAHRDRLQNEFVYSWDYTKVSGSFNPFVHGKANDETYSDCVEINDRGKWNDLGCWLTRQFICQTDVTDVKQPAITTTTTKITTPIITTLPTTKTSTVVTRSSTTETPQTTITPVAHNTSSSPTHPTVKIITKVYLECPDTWTVLGTRCIKAFNQQQHQKTWTDAESHCTSYGGHLIDILNNYTNTAVLSVMHEHRTYWIGASDLNNDGQFEFTHQGGSQALSMETFQPWAKSQPTNEGNGDDCVAIKVETGKWYSYYCNINANFICQINATKSDSSTIPSNDKTTTTTSIQSTSTHLPTTNPTTTPITTPEPEVKACFDKSWTLINNSTCFKAFQQSKSWGDARKVCQSHGSDLAVVDSPQTNRQIHSLLRSRVRYWIGARTVDEEGTFEFVGGQSADQFQELWAVGEPSYSDTASDCVGIDGTSGLWDDLPCTHLSGGFVCQSHI